MTEEIKGKEGWEDDRHCTIANPRHYDALKEAYTRASTPTTRSIIMNFGKLDYMNSSGIGVLVTWLIRMNRQKQRMLCYGLSEHYQSIFATTRLNDAIKNYATEAEALVAAK